MTQINFSSQTHSPRADMNQRISSAASAGTISSTDATALSSALDSIDSSLSGGTSGKLSPTDMKSKVDSLISDQVSSGTLTQDQASELQALFAQGGQQQGADLSSSTDTSASTDTGAIGSTGTTQGPKGMRGPPPPPPSSSDDDDDDTSVSSTSSSSSSSSLDAEFASLISTLQKLREGLANSGSTYSLGDSSSASANTSASTTSGQIVNQLA